MADEEAVLKKKLEDTTDFDERRAIRQQLRDLRKKKLEALESSTSANDRTRRRERVKKEEQTTVITETKSTQDSSQPGIQTKVEVNYSRTTVISDGPSENGVESEPNESEKTVEEESVSVENENSLEEQPEKMENGTHFNVQVNGEKSPKEEEESEQVDSSPQEPSTQTETVETSESADAEPETKETPEEAEKDPPEEEMEEVELTPEVVAKMEDVDMLEKLLKEVPLNEYELRKAIRLQIRQMRVKKEKSKESKNVSDLGNVKQTKHDNEPGEDQFRGNMPSGDEPSEKIEAQDKTLTGTDNQNTDTVESDCDVDDSSSTKSSITSESPSESDNPGKPPPRPPRPVKTSSASSASELTGDFKSRILGNPSGPALKDLSKKGKPSGPVQVDFRSQLKKTGLRADKDLTAQGKKQQQFLGGDVRGKLKATGADPSRNLSATRVVGKKQEGPVRVDFRGNLKQSETVDGKKVPPPRPPPTYLTKKAEAAKSQATKDSTSKEEGTPTGSSERRISSSDLFNMLHKPVESSKEGYLVQRGLKKAEGSKTVPQKFVAPTVDASKEDDKFKARMAQRKERSEKHFPPGKGSKTDRKMSAGVETKDFQSILKRAGVQQPKTVDESVGADSERRPSKGSERFSVDIQDKNELHKLRADLLREKEQKDKGAVTRSTEKSTEVEEIDGGKVTKGVTKTTEVHKQDGVTTTVTKTTKTTEIQGRGRGTSIEAMLAQKKKERMMAKKQQQADTRSKRMAFKEQLEAQSPKVEGSGRSFQTGNAAINSLQEWCRRRTKYHEGVEIQNFSSSWANGLAMCALLNYFLPDKIPYETLNPSDKRANWALAFKVANEEGIEPLLELEDVMALENPEPKSLITYVHFIYQHFNEKQQQQKKA